MKLFCEPGCDNPADNLSGRIGADGMEFRENQGLLFHKTASEEAYAGTRPDMSAVGARCVRFSGKAI